MIESNGDLAIRLLTSPPFFTHQLTEWPQRPAVNLINAGFVEIDGLQVETLAQRHSGGSVGFRLGELAYITDTDPGNEHEPFLKGVRLLFADTMYDEEDYRAEVDKKGSAEHGHSKGNAKLAVAIGARRLALVHLNPRYTHERIDALLADAREIFPDSFIPDEGLIYAP
jgi:ribonuclease BN (tRNA processing enzyme)